MTTTKDNFRRFRKNSSGNSLNTVLAHFIPPIPRMKPFLIATLLVVMTCSSAGEENGEKTSPTQRISLFFGAAAGNFGMTIKEFKEVYHRRSMSRIFVAGVGDRSAYLFGKFRQFYAHGRSRVENADAKGSAEWKQKFFSIGARLMSPDVPIYLEGAYVISEAEEFIWTHDPDVSELRTDWKTRTQGVGIAIGIMIDFPKPLRTFIEFEHTSMLKLGTNPSGRTVPQIGGNLLSGGFMFIL